MVITIRIHYCTADLLHSLPGYRVDLLLSLPGYRAKVYFLVISTAQFQGCRAELNSNSTAFKKPMGAESMRGDSEAESMRGGSEEAGSLTEDHDSDSSPATAAIRVWPFFLLCNNSSTVFQTLMEYPADSSSAPEVESATSSRTGATEQSGLEEPNDIGAKTEQSGDKGIEQKVHDLMDRITASARSAPNPRLLHALASILEQEARFIQESGHSSPSNARTSHEIGHLGNLLRENDEFFELVSSKFLSDTRYTIGVHAAAARLLLACPSTSMYPHDIEGAILENIKRWAMEDMIKSFGEECHSKVEAAGQEASDAEMLKTYATGLLPLALNGNSPVVDVLTCGLSAKLMRFLRIQVLGETSANQKDITLGPESRQAIGSSSIKEREDIKGRMRHVADVTRPDFSRLVEEAFPENQNVDKDIEKGDESSSHVEKKSCAMDNFHVYSSGIKASRTRF